MKTGIYLRVSTEDQADNGFGLVDQREKCEAMATVKGWQVVREYCDDGISGTKDESERPALAELLSDACSGEVEAVIVAALDRLGRSTRLVLRIVDHLDGCNAELASCKESLDTSTPAGRFVLRMFASLAELDRDNIVERTTAGRDARGRFDGDRGGRLPMGYIRTSVTNNEGRAVVGVDLEEARIVRRIFRLYAGGKKQGGLTLTQVANRLNSEGITTRRGSIWHASSVREIINNLPKYRGGYRGESKVLWPPIIER